jgi:hypothetical protein
MMPVGLDTEEWLLMQQVITHYARQLHEARLMVADLKRRLDAADERASLLEGLAYGATFP